MESMDGMSWTPPGLGVWEAEGAHFPKPVPRLGRKEFADGFAKGFQESTGRYGLLLSHLQPGFVNDFMYMKAVAFGAPEDAKGPPPKPILWLLTRLHPGMRARIEETRKAFDEKRWREDLRRWDEVDKPAALARHRELLAVDLGALDDAALALHARECIEHVREMAKLHHRYTISCSLPVGDLLAHVTEWTGESAADILGMLQGSTPISRGILASELEALAAVIRDDAEAKAILAGRDPRSVIAALTARERAVGEASRAFFDGIRYRSLSYEIGAKCAGEMPEMLVAAVRAAVNGSGHGRGDESAVRIETMRAKIPAEHRTTFDALLEEARAVNRLRDERGIYADGFAVGIGRRVALEAGRRLVARDALRDAEDAVDLDLDELVALLTGKPGPSANEVHARVVWRQTMTVADIPPHLGGVPSGPPDANVLPAPARRAARAVEMAIGNIFTDSSATSTREVVRGLSVNHGVYEGTARLVMDASQFERLQQGDVLVTRSTAPYFNVVLPLLGALVTDRGGQLSHAAIVAREYGIPGIVGTKDATTRIPDGARVRVDGTSGEITILSRPS